MRPAVAMIAVCISAFACRRRPQPQVVETADPVASAVGSVITKEPPIAAALEQRSDGIYLVSLPPGISARVVKVDPAAACVVEPIPRSSEEPLPGPDRRNLVCPGVSLPISIDDEGISFGSHRVDLPRRATLGGAGVVPRVAAPACAPGSIGPRVTVEPRYRLTSPSALEVELRLPELGVVLPLRAGATRVHSTHWKAADALGLWIAAGMSASTTIEIRREVDTLRVTEEFEMVGKEISKHTTAAYWLPCGASLLIKKTSYRTPSYFSIGEDCPACTETFLSCRRHCDEDLTDSHGEYTPDGNRCMDDCRTKRVGCERTCRRH